jgi:hypothetical protein
VVALAHKLGIEHEIEYADAGIDPDTVIIYGPVPAKYLRDADAPRKNPRRRSRRRR